MRSGVVLTSIIILFAAAGPLWAEAAPEAVMPNAEKIVLLTRTTLLTLNDALQTGNFTVLRDISAPGFRQANTAGGLAQSFSDLASKNIDLSAVSVMMPQLTEQPQLDQKAGMLRLRGYFPGQPIQINFELIYEAVDGHWRLFGLSVQPSSSGLPSNASKDLNMSAVKKKTRTPSAEIKK